ncbi:MAG: hypothetical protein Q7R70_04655 [Candidatus Diapherotrites archaeon]|nr:hypothetical protein [Candidatus Diapherotrites archaeon]
MKTRTIAGIFLVLAVLLAGCGEQPKPGPIPDQNFTPVPTESAIPKGDRLLGIDVGEAQGVNYADAFAIAKGTGMDFVQLSLQWDSVETSPGVFDDTWLDIANSFYPAQKTKIALNFNAIDTVKARMPSDLQGKAFNDPTVIERYNKALEHVLEKLKDSELASLAVGNEIDVFLGNNEQKYAEYSEFVKKTREFAKTKKPELKVGTKATFGGLTGESSGKLKDLEKNTDVLLVTYYAINPDFTVKSNGKVIEDFDKITALYPEKEIYFLEAGYPSSEILGSSFQKQAEFVNETFTAWDRHKSQITAVNFLWLHDVQQSSLSQIAGYYGSSDPKFLAFLGSLGLRTFDGKDKPAWKQLAAETKAREW